VAPSITVKVALPALATKTLLVTGSTARASGLIPTATLVVALVAPLITVTVALPELAT